jgi:hypothetical protein
MDNEYHSAVSYNRGFEFLEVKYVFIAQSLQGQKMTIEASSLSRHFLNALFLHSTCPLLLAFLLISRKSCGLNMVSTHTFM